ELPLRLGRPEGGEDTQQDRQTPRTGSAHRRLHRARVRPGPPRRPGRHFPTLNHTRWANPEVNVKAGRRDFVLRTQYSVRSTKVLTREGNRLRRTAPHDIFRTGYSVLRTEYLVPRTWHLSLLRKPCVPIPQSVQAAQALRPQRLLRRRPGPA